MSQRRSWPLKAALNAAASRKKLATPMLIVVTFHITAAPCGTQLMPEPVVGAADVAGDGHCEERQRPQPDRLSVAATRCASGATPPHTSDSVPSR